MVQANKYGEPQQKEEYKRNDQYQSVFYLSLLPVLFVFSYQGCINT